jgi:hypothetical protein
MLSGNDDEIIENRTALAPLPYRTGLRPKSLLVDRAGMVPLFAGGQQRARNDSVGFFPQSNTASGIDCPSIAQVRRSETSREFGSAIALLAHR